MRRVWKFATGVDIPEGAQYLSTQVEKITTDSIYGNGTVEHVEKNELVWHYFLVEVTEESALECASCRATPDRTWLGIPLCKECWEKPPSEEFISMLEKS